MTEVKIGIYRHYKGREYKVLGLAKHSETLDEYVVYQAMYGNNEIWIRPKKMFFEQIEQGGKKLMRFQYIEG